jgi:hypothetical protein
MERKKNIVKPLSALILLMIITVEFMFLSLFYDLDFNFIVYSPAPDFQIYSSFPLHESPAILVMLKHECLFARVEVHISSDFGEVMLSFSDGRIVNLTGVGEYVFTVVLPGRLPLSHYVSQYINGHYISTDKPVEVFLEEARHILHYEYEPNAFILVNVTVISGSANIRVKIWGVML